MSRDLVAAARASPLVAASGAVALVTLLAATVGVVSVAGPGAPPDPGGRRLGTAILATVSGVGLLWLLFVARATRGVIDYADGGGRPTGPRFALALVEGTVALAMVVVASAAASLSRGSDAGDEILAVGLYVVAAIGLVLALASLARAAVELLGRD
ncbi:hypothetical protein [Halobaculum sp. EA56]|uniref:hypothetical protein n=1 Tax=Halobaculum sp. EA56 TaxID=3421648 RepID=UPI003EBC761F